MVAVVAAIASALAIAVSAPAAQAPSADRTATDAYLTAGYGYAQATLANVQASRTAIEGLASRIGSECHGVLQGAPPEPSPGTPFGRRVGESKREDEQLSELEGELSESLRLTLEQTDRQALLAFAVATRSLQWSNPAITRTVSTRAAGLEAELALPIPNVCADAQAWVASGYKTLTPATKQLNASQEEIDKKEFTGSFKSLASLFVPYEGRAERALIAKTRTLEVDRAKALAGLSYAAAAALGVAHEPTPSVSHHPAGATVIGKGRTAAGGEYEALLLPHGPSAGRRQGEECPPSHPLRMNIVTTLNGDISGCFSRSKSLVPASVNCSEGLLTIFAQTGPAVRQVSLRLSNGRRIISQVALVPATLGGPVGFYYQVVRGPYPIPISLTELDARGKSLRVLKLHRFAGCSKHLLTFLHGGIRTLVNSRVPEGPAFSIVGQAYRFLGHIHFALQVDVEGAGGGGESPSGRRPSLFSWALWQECKPRPYAILYGLLKRPTDTVLARISGKLHPLRHVAIPAHLHAGGALVYIASSTTPSELQVRNPAGKALLTEHLGNLGAQATEMCQAETEAAARLETGSK